MLWRLLVVATGIVAAGCGLPSGPLFGRLGVLPRMGPTFDVKSVLTASAIRGANWEIERRVPVVDDRFMFRIRTRNGVIPAHGMDMLELRLREMYSIQLAERIRNDAHVQAGIASGLQKTGQGLSQLFSDPGGTLLRAPEGVREMIQERLDPADSRAGSLARRRLAALIQCDPETANPVLKWILDEMAVQEDLGDFATGAAIGFVVPVPGVGLLSTSAEMGQMLATTPPHQVNETIEVRLRQLGLDAGLCRRFCLNGNYTTIERLVFMQYIESLRGVAGLSIVLESMLDVYSETEALGRIHEAMLWAQLSSRRPVRQFIKAELPAAVLSDGALAIVSAVDYLADAREVVKVAARYRTTRRDAAVVLYTTARLAPEAQKALQAAGVDVSGADGSLR